MAEVNRPRLGRFVIEGELGRGEWGEVLAARDPRLDRRVALKRIPPDLATDSRRREQFESEARLLAAVNHPNVATLFGLEDDDQGAPHLVMELVPGPTLAERLLEGALTATEALDVGCQLAAGIEAAHAAGVVHGDLKPANVKLTPFGHVKVLDFGIARRSRAPAGGPAETSSPAKGGVSGSPGYMGPEQLAGVAADERTDCWSFGCVLFECLAGVRAVPGETLSEVLTATAHGEPDWSALPDETSEELRTLLRACLSRELGDRPSSVSAVHEELERLRAIAIEQPPAATLTARRLPVPTTSFVGRESELAELESLLEEARLVTLTGVGGTGKSRLALEAVRALEDAAEPSVHLVELAALSDGGLLDSQALGALGLKERPGLSPREVLSEALSEGRHLLVLDNCEHLLPACASLCTELLASCPELKVMTTSREGLGLPGEHVLVVPPLTTASEKTVPTAASLTEVDGVRLFIDRARAARRGFELTEDNAAAVASVVRRLDGLPLGLELAAARMRALSVAQLDERLSESYRVLTGSPRADLPRQRTMEAAIEWSHDLLTEKERVLYRRLSVFAGGWTLEFAERVCAGDGLDESDVLDLLAHLVDKSLIVVEQDAFGPRYRYLEPVRHHAREKLAAAGDGDKLRLRHLESLKGLAEDWYRLWNLDGDPRRMRWCEAERENLLAAFHYCRSQPGLGSRAVELAHDVRAWWGFTGRLDEGRRILEMVLERTGENAKGQSYFWVLREVGKSAHELGDLSAARAYYERCVTLSRQLDGHGLVTALRALSLVTKDLGDVASTRALLDEAITVAEESGDDMERAEAHDGLARHLLREGEFEAARAQCELALSIVCGLGEQTEVAAELILLSQIETEDSRFATALLLLEEAGQILRGYEGSPICSWYLYSLGCAALAAGEDARAETALQESARTSRESGNKKALHACLRGLGAARLWRGDVRAARQPMEEAVALSHRIGPESALPGDLRLLATLSVAEGDTTTARSLHSRALELERRLDTTGFDALWLVRLAGALVGMARDETLAARLLGAHHAAREASGGSLIHDGTRLDLRLREQLRHALGDEALERALAEGAKLTVEQAIEEVLSGQGPARQGDQRSTGEAQ